jgi:hypothetical protein
MRKALFAGLTVALLVGTALILAELSLRVLERLPRRDVLDYPDTWREGGLGPGGYLAEGFRGEVIDGYGGTVRWTNNSQGFRYDRDVARDPPPGLLRVLSMGDSFTAGYRVDQRETFSHLLERRLERDLGPSEVLISCVEDPAAGLHWLDLHGWSFRPQAVLLGITLGNDIAQTHVALDPRGPFRLQLHAGAERITRREEEATFGFRHGLEPLLIPGEHRESASVLRRAAVKLEHLRIVGWVHEPAWPIASWYGDPAHPRLFDPTHGLGFYLASPPPEIEEAFGRLERLLRAYALSCARRGITLLVALFPQRYQIQERDWRQTIVKYGLKEPAFDLMAPNRRVLGFCRENGITCIDPTESMREAFARSGKSLYFPRGDMHWNRGGQRAFYEAAAEVLLHVLRREPSGNEAT